jgi:pyruvate-formate lyase-activating enzyme
LDHPEAQEYPSCEWIEGGIAFNRSSINTCLIEHHHRGLPFVSPYRGGDIPLRELLEVREEIRAANRNGGYPACAGCAHLKTRAWERREHPIDLVGIAHFARCNIECNYCFLQTKDPSTYADGMTPYPLIGAVEALIDSGMLAPGATIDWGGGEPTIYREFSALLQRLLAHGTFHYVHTNGTRLPPGLRDMERLDHIHVICSVDAGFRETYLAMKKRDQLDRVWRNLQEYRALGARVTMKYIVKTENCSDAELDAFLSRAVASGMDDLIVDVDYNEPAAAPAVVAAVGRLLHRARRAGIQARFGFTGDNFRPETGMAGRAIAAFEREERQAVVTLLEERGYVHGATLDTRLAALLTAIEAHDASLLAQCIEKEAEIRRLAEALARLRRPGGVLRMIVLGVLRRIGITARKA